MNAAYSRSARLASGASLFILGTAALVVAYTGPARDGVLDAQVPGLTWVLGITGGLLVALGVLLLGGPPWQKESRPAIRAALWAHGLLGVAGVLLASRLDGIVAASVLSIAGFELVVAALCVRALRRRGSEAGGRRSAAVARNPLAVVLAFLLSSAPLAAQDLLIADARLVDPHAETVRPGALLLRGDTIAAVLDAAPADYDGAVLDVGGRYVIPGLVDLHVHSYGNLSPSGVERLGTEAAARRMLAAGVTRFLDLFADEDAVFALRDRQRSEGLPGGLPGAALHAAGPLLTAPGGYGTHMGLPTRTVATPAEARRVVADLAQRQPDVVKLAYLPDDKAFAPMTRPAMEALIEAAGEAGLPTVAHVGSWTGVRDVAEAGVSAVTHLPAGPIPADVVALLRDRDVAVIPALVGEHGLGDLVADAHRRPLFAAVASADVVAAYRDLDAEATGLGAHIRAVAAERATALATVRTLHEAGVRVLAGTDAGVLGTVQGFSLHHELALLAEAGLPAWAVLRAATTEAGAFLGEPAGLREGDRADLVVLHASPLDDVANTQSVADVVRRGTVVDRAALLRAPASTPPIEQALLDDFASGTLTSALGTTWRVVRDEAAGGNSTIEAAVRGGALHVEAAIRPAPGGLGFVEVALPLDGADAPRDVTAYDGVRVRLRVRHGTLALKVQTAEVTNYDYPAVVLEPSAVVRELELPFSAFAPLWSPPVEWTGRRVLGLAFSAGGVEPAEVAFEVEELALYRDAAPRSP